MKYIGAFPGQSIEIEVTTTNVRIGLIAANSFVAIDLSHAQATRLLAYLIDELEDKIPNPFNEE